LSISLTRTPPWSTPPRGHPNFLSPGSLLLISGGSPTGRSSLISTERRRLPPPAGGTELRPADPAPQDPGSHTADPRLRHCRQLVTAPPASTYSSSTTTEMTLPQLPSTCSLPWRMEPSSTTAPTPDSGVLASLSTRDLFDTPL
jgi:hypothetical protein